jgi:hypothetical protein
MQIDYVVLKETAISLGLTDLPAELPELSKISEENNAELLQTLHTVLLDVSSSSLCCIMQRFDNGILCEF